MGAWGKDAQEGIMLGIWAKSYNPGGYVGGYPRGVIAEMEFRRIMGWPKRAYHGD